MKSKNLGRIIEDFAIGFLVALAILSLVFSFFPSWEIESEILHSFLMSRMIERFGAVIMLIVAYNLYQRKRVAWAITVCLLVANLLLHLFGQQPLFVKLYMLCAALILAILCWRWKSFFKVTNRRTMKSGAIVGGVVLLTTLANGGITHWLYARHAGETPPRFMDCLLAGLGNMFGMDSDLFAEPSRHFRYIETTIAILTWIGILVAILFVVQPFLQKRKTSSEDLEHARKLVLAHGQNPGSYLTLEDDKTLYFGNTVDGVVPYGTVGETVVINGDPICAPADFKALLTEFTTFCKDASFNMFFLSTTNKYLDVYKEMEFEVVKCGEEARFELETYDIKGKKGAKMRANINKATREGLTVKEYEVRKQRDSHIENEFDRISAEWLKGKSSDELVFTLGGVGLDEPLDKRYFYAYDEAGTIMGFVVFCPYETGYMADVTRRAEGAPSGIMHKIIFEAFQVFKEEGIKEGSMGLAPLVNILEEGQTPNMPEKLLNLIYEKFNSVYEFKNLYRAKEAYSPSRWEPGYFVYSPKMMTPQMAYAVVAIQNPKGMLDYVKAFFKGKEKEEKKKKDMQKLEQEEDKKEEKVPENKA